jgi:hypothetical protein
MLKEHMIAAQDALAKALYDYENNGIRYEPADREALINLILQAERLGNRLSEYMTELPFLDSHPIGTPVPEATPGSVAKIFEELDRSSFISPEGPLEKHMAYQQLKRLFDNTSLSIVEALHLLHRQKFDN